TAVMTIVGQVIAVGIFLTPAGMAKSVVSPAWLFAIWLLIGLMTLSGALCYAELASRFPQAGGTYVYLREAFGDGLAFLYGWTVLLVLDPGLTAIFGVGIAAYSAYLFPLTPTEKLIVALGSILIIGVINILGARLGVGFLKALTVLKVGALLFIIFYGFGARLGSFSNLSPFFSQPPDMFGAFAGGIVGAFFAFAGWWEVTRISGEIKDPKRNIPKALVIGVLVITILYISTSAVFMYLVPVAGITSDETFAAQAGEALFGKAGGFIFSAVVVVSLLGTLFAYMMVSPRVYYAMARDGLFFESFGRLHPRFGTPHRATYIQILIAGLLILTGTFEQIVSYFFFVVTVFIALSIAGLFKIHRREFDGYKTPLFPVLPLFFLGLTAVALFFVAMQRPLNALAGVLVVLVGAPVYYFFFRAKVKFYESF
ncbi:MAG TPA: amino acid permease, partial [Pyrinomonadaceae bacterium]|nr:amino acid permease [Pyrinomonadaceae bacterium]